MTEERAKRKLSGILSADAVGYSRLMQEDEASTIRNLEDSKELMSELIEQFKGRVVDAPGDNLLAEFSSVVDATECAVEIQRKLKDKNAEIPDNRRMDFRIGVNLGDVVEEANRIYGDGVNIAARIEGLAEPGGICISRIAFDQVKNKLKLGYEYLGEHSVKNIAEPVRAYKVLIEPEYAGKVIGEEKPKTKRWRWAALVSAAMIVFGVIVIWNFYFRKPPIEPASVEKMAYPLPDKPSIAVLPFDNLSGDTEQEYIADGISENIITALSHMRQMFVIARNSSFTYKGKPVKVQQVSEELGVRYILEGSVLKSGEKIRITAQLIDALSGGHIWSERYDRDLKDFFNLIDEITLAISVALQVELTEGEQARKLTTYNLDAWRYVNKGLGVLWKGGKENIAKARELFKKALEIDPEYAGAVTCIGWTYWGEARYGLSDSRQESFKRAIEMANKSLAMDANQSGPHELLSMLYLYQKQHDKAIEEGRKCIALGPNRANGHFWLGVALYRSGNFEEAVQMLEKAMRLNPQEPRLYLGHMMNAYYWVGRFEESLAMAEQLIVRAQKVEDWGGVWWGYWGSARAHIRLGQESEARKDVANALKIRPDYSLDLDRSKTLYKAGIIDREHADMRKAGFPEHPPLKLPDKPSIAVLPFINMSGDPEQEYFSDGLTDELIGDLAKISGILVISRNSAFTYKGKQVKIAQIAKELNVRYVLEGSVQKSGDKVRIRAQLIDGQTDHHLWAESYDGVLNDIFDLQDKITSKIVSALAVKLSPFEKEKVSDKGTENVLAYEAFLKGRQYYDKQTPKDLLTAIEYYKQATKFDPNFSRAYAAIGYTYLIGGNQGWSKEMGTEWGTIRLLARNYLEMAMENPSHEAYALAGAIELHRRNFQKAISFAEKAYNYAPNSDDRMTELAWILAFTERTEESIELYNKAIRISDPSGIKENTAMSYIFIGVNHFSMGDLEEAITNLEKGLSLNPNVTNFLCFLASSYALLGRETEAKKALADYLKGRRFPPPIQNLYYAWPFKDSKVFDRFAQGLVKAGLRGDPKKYYKLSKENKLTGQEIRKLLFGKTFSGYVFGIKELQYSYDISDEGELEYSYRGKTYTGKAWMEGNNICVLREKYYGGLKDCREIYRNPDGDELTKTEYFNVTDYGIFLFSVEK